MNRKLVTVVAAFCLVLMAAAIAPASAAGINGVDVACTTGAHITNGIEVIVNMRPGYTYTATALGINGFDPVLAVLDAAGNGLCTDDDPDAAIYSVHLPTTGYVPASPLSSQISFSPDSLGFSDISLVVGGYNGATGEFVLLLEGMAVTANDGRGATAGDPYSVQITQGMLNSGVDLTAYMISLDAVLDPYITVVNGANVPIMTCDDAGSANCMGQSAPLSGYYVTRLNGSRLSGYQYDAMLHYDLAGMQLNSDPNLNYLGFLMTSYNQNTYGQYVAAFHLASA